MLTSVILTSITLYCVLYSLWSTTGGITTASFLPSSYVSQFSCTSSSHSACPVIHPVVSSLFYFWLVKHTLVPLPLCLALLLSLPLSDPLQTCLFGATTHLGPCCCSPAVIVARIRTSTEKCIVCVCVSVYVCLSSDACREKEKENDKNGKKRQKRVATHSNHMCLNMSRLPRYSVIFFHKVQHSQERSEIKIKIKSQQDCITQ